MLIPFGVKIYKEKLSDQYYNYLLNQYEDNLDSYKEVPINANYWGGSNREFMTGADEEVTQHAQAYLKSLGLERNLKHHNQWINIQANDGFLGIHDHFGNISYVIYLKVPDCAKNYMTSKESAMPYAEGMISFLFGHQTSLSSDIIHFIPEEGTIFMFPSELKHYVYPFKDKDSKRVSISGNLLFV